VAVKIRLMRVGKRKQPTYRVVVADARSPRDGRFIEIIGQYAPREEPSIFTIDEDRALHWLQVGALPTEQVSKLLDASGVYARFEQENGRAPATKAKIGTTTRRAKNEPEPAPEPAPTPAPEAAAGVAPDAEEPSAASEPEADATDTPSEAAASSEPEAAEETAGDAAVAEKPADEPADEPAEEPSSEEPA
jgi:small subunit ribosomal protein S16